MSTLTTPATTRRGTARRPRPERTVWTCPNCQRETRPPRKRCADCGTSRY
ncbi:hypothetical protein [Geodermatophilus ruber]|uniref:RanBP2-type domain-containing protein n=1 Tax=Geodermatophilus ruber TaxID=504800 RepID=A0A1I4H2M8_9ACTN|nr:hypothetical protein [Geodermatophilus ruber]SFL36479.1 hypothetical protein SAMN04488085_1104 [Geodermatophilus ruber]